MAEQRRLRLGDVQKRISSKVDKEKEIRAGRLDQGMRGNRDSLPPSGICELQQCIKSEHQLNENIEEQVREMNRKTGKGHSIASLTLVPACRTLAIRLRVEGSLCVHFAVHLGGYIATRPTPSLVSPLCRASSAGFQMVVLDGNLSVERTATKSRVGAI